jgi:divalent metal cation (Fe/Co/Zn/Cd) transporter
MKWLAVALLLVTFAYNFGEGFFALWAGLQANSVVLLSFGADSYIEVFAAAAVIWRLSYADEAAGERAERRALRFIGASFLLLAGAIVFQSVFSLASGAGADESTLGLLVLVASVTLMPALSLVKLWTAARTGMPVLAAKAKETMVCSYLSVTALGGVLAVLLFGWWWLDPVAALLMVPWLIKEGREGLNADACFDDLHPCFCRSCLFGIRDCTPVCCTPACC